MDKAKLALLCDVFKYDFKHKGNKIIEKRFIRFKVTPLIAVHLLTLNTENRPIKPRVLKTYTESMKAGKWVYNPTDQGMIDWFIVVRNMQHRLSSVVESGVTIEMDIIVGCDPALFHIMDTGRVRTGGDVLAISGYKNSTNLSAAANRVLHININGFSPSSFTGKGKRVNSDLLEFCQNTPSFVHNVEYAITLYSSSDKLFTTTEIAAMLWFFRKKDEKKGESFWYEACTGEGISMESPAYQLRKVFVKNKGSQYKLNRPSRFALIIKAWNLYLKGKTVKRLSYNPEKDKFPKPAK